MRASVLRRLVGSCVVCSSVALAGCNSPFTSEPETRVSEAVLTEAGTDRATFSVEVFRDGETDPALTTGVCVGVEDYPDRSSGICGEVPAQSALESYTTTVPVSGLTPDTEYKAMSYIIRSQAGFLRGAQQVTFRTLALTPAEVSTGAVSGVTATGAVVAGTVTNAGTTAVTERGVCYATTPTPVRSGSCVVAGSGAGSFSATLAGLTPSTSYYARAFATNGAGTAYGSDVQFTTPQQPGFTLAAQTTSQLVVRGTTGSAVGLSVTRQGGFTGAVTVAVTGLPSGVTATVESPGTATSGSVAFNVSSQADVGTFELQLVGSASGLTSQSVPFSLIVADALGLTLSAPGKLDLTRGGSSSATIGIERTGGWTGEVAFELHGLPSGITGSFNPVSTTGNFTFLNLEVGANVAAGSSFDIEVRATGSNGATASATITINVS